MSDACRHLGKRLMGQGQFCCRLLVPLWHSWSAQEQKIQPVPSLKVTDDICHSSLWNACCVSSAQSICMCAGCPTPSDHTVLSLPSLPAEHVHNHFDASRWNGLFGHTLDDKAVRISIWDLQARNTDNSWFKMHEVTAISWFDLSLIPSTRALMAVL